VKKPGSYHMIWDSLTRSLIREPVGVMAHAKERRFSLGNREII